MVVTGKSPTTHKSAASEQQAKGPTGLLASKLPILKDGDKKALIEESKNAFCKRRRVQISGIPPGTKNEVFGCKNKKLHSYVLLQSQFATNLRFKIRWASNRQYGSDVVV